MATVGIKRFNALVSTTAWTCQASD